jgi:hypothetical protein
MLAAGALIAWLWTLVRETARSTQTKHVVDSQGSQGPPGANRDRLCEIIFRKQN